MHNVTQSRYGCHRCSVCFRADIAVAVSQRMRKPDSTSTRGPASLATSAHDVTTSTDDVSSVRAVADECADACRTTCW